MFRAQRTRNDKILKNYAYFKLYSNNNITYRNLAGNAVGVILDLQHVADIDTTTVQVGSTDR